MIANVFGSAKVAACTGTTPSRRRAPAAPGTKITWRDGVQALSCILRYRFPD